MLSFEIRIFHAPNSTDSEVVRVRAESPAEALLQVAKKMDRSDSLYKLIIVEKSGALPGEASSGVAVDRSAVLNTLEALKKWDRLRRGGATHLQEEAEVDLHDRLEWLTGFLTTTPSGSNVLVLDRGAMVGLKKLFADWWRAVRGGYSARRIEDLESDLSFAASDLLEGALKSMTGRNANLRSRAIRLAHENPELRAHLLPLLKEASPKTFWDMGKVPEVGQKVEITKPGAFQRELGVVVNCRPGPLAGGPMQCTVRLYTGEDDLKLPSSYLAPTSKSGPARVAAPVGPKELKALSKVFTGEVTKEDLPHINYQVEESGGKIVRIHLEDRDGHLGHIEASLEEREAKSYGTTLEAIASALKAGKSRERVLFGSAKEWETVSSPEAKRFKEEAKKKGLKTKARGSGSTITVTPEDGESFSKVHSFAKDFFPSDKFKVKEPLTDKSSFFEVTVLPKALKG